MPGVDPTSIGVVPLTSRHRLRDVQVDHVAAVGEDLCSWCATCARASCHRCTKATPNHIYTYGETAINVDFAKVLSRKMPLFIAVVVGLSFILLMIAFRSLVIPLTAAVMNLLAAAGSFGLVVAIFQYGWAVRRHGRRAGRAASTPGSR